MKYVLRKAIAIALMIAMISALIPAQGLGLSMAAARAEAASTAAVTPSGYADVLAQAGELLGAGGGRASGDWRYVLLEEKNIAVITGYEGEAAEELTVPELLGGTDVAGIAAGALSGLKGVKRIGVPTNVIAIGKGALPAGVTVLARSGVYAQKWARKNGHAFTSTSDYDFVSGVVDLTGTRPENFNRVSAEEIWLRELEASQISVGTRFFLLDPANLYQISYYMATELTTMAGGFVAVKCITPEVDDILNYYEAKNETMMVDYSTLRLADGATVNEETSKFQSGSVKGELSLGFKPDIDLGDGWELQLDISQNISWEASYEVGLFVEDSVTIEQTDKFNASIALEYTHDIYSDGESDDDSEDAIKENIKNFSSKAGKMLYDKADVDLPMGSAVVFSVGGILNAAVSVRAVFEASGKISLAYTNTSVTTYTFAGGNLDKSTKQGARSFEGSVEGTLKAGVQISLELYVTAIKAFTVGLFIGIQAEIKYDFSQLLNLLGNFISSSFTGKVVFDEVFNLNMMDCVEIDVYALIEFNASLGIGKLSFIDGKVTLTRQKFAKLHCHMLHVKFAMESNDDGSYTYTADGCKNLPEKIHIASRCPFDVKTAQFMAERNGRWEQLCRYINLPIGTKVEEPEVDMAKDYGAKLIGWHTDASLDEDSLVESWPHTLTEDVVFYAETSPLHKVHLINAGGVTLGVSPAIADPEAKVEYDFAQRGGRVAEGEQIALPEADTDGEAIVKWVQVESREALSPIGSEMEPGTAFEVTEDCPDEIYLCALTGKDIMARFYSGADDSFQTVYATRGNSIIVPECEGSIACRRFAGWEASDGTILQPGDEIPTDETTSTVLVYSAVWEYTGELTAEHLDDITLGDPVSVGSPSSNSKLFTWYETDGGVVIDGFSGEITPVNVYVPGSVSWVDDEGNSHTRSVEGVYWGAFSGTESLRSIAFSGSIDWIGDGVLDNCTSLMMIDLSEMDITEVPACLAAGCTSLACVLLPDGIEKMGDGAFRDCRSLSRANIDCDLDWEAFKGCTNLREVSIGRGCTSIGKEAFYGCTRLTGLNIPDSVTEIGTGIVYGCTALTEIEVNSGVTTICDYVFDIGENSALEKLTLGFGVESIETYALDNNGDGHTALKELVLPASLKFVGEAAFEGAGVENLTVAFPNNASNYYGFSGMRGLKTLTVTSGAIGEGCFANAANLETLYIGAGVTSIGANAFEGCDSLKNVIFEEGVLSIGDYAFARCASLTEISLPDSLIELGYHIFEESDSLQSLSVGNVVNLLEDGNHSFDIGENSNLTELTLREGVEVVRYKVFNNDGAGFQNLETVNLPSTMRLIGERAFEYAGLKMLMLNGSVELNSGAFYGCERLEELVINGGSIGPNAFYGNSMLRKITVNAETIGEGAFQNCPNLTDLTLGDGVRRVNAYAFADCPSLVNVNLGNGVRRFGSHVFENGSSLTEIAFPDSVCDYGNDILSGCLSLETLTIGGGQYAIEESDFAIGEGSALKSVVIREGVARIETCCFENYENFFPELTSISFPSTLQYVGYHAFHGTGLTNVTFRSGVHLDEFALYGLESLTSVTLPGGSVGPYACFDNRALTSVYLGNQVERVDACAFENCTALSSIYLGSSIRSISDYAFKGCASLKRLTVPDSVETFSGSALEGCTGLEYLSIGAAIDGAGQIPFGEGAKLRTLIVRNGATRIADNAFRNGDYYLKNLETVSLPSTMTYVGSGSFENSGVQRVIIRGEAEIGYHAFRNCARLEEVYISSGALHEYAFTDAVALKKVTFLSGAIDNHVFVNCASLESIELGEGVTKIGDRAFYNCRSLKSLTIPDSVTEIGEDVIWGCTSLETLTVGGGLGDRLYWYYVSRPLPFRVGPGSKLKTLVLCEGITHVDEGVFANPMQDSTDPETAYGFTELENVVFPDSLEYVGNGAFAKSAVRSIALAGNVVVTDNAFANLTSLKSVRIAEGRICGGAFYGCSNLENVELGEGVTEIGASAFAGCSSLKSLTIPDSVTSCGWHTIYGCTALERLSLGGGYERVPESVFEIGEGSSLRTLEIREGVIRLENYSFSNGEYGHPNLTTITLPDTLVYLGEYNLQAWPKLRHLYMRYGMTLPSADTVSPDLTLYTDYYNAKVDDFAIQHNLRYIIGMDEAFPAFTLKYAAPAGLVQGAVYDGGDEFVTCGVLGETAELPENFDLIGETSMSFTQAFTPDDPVVAEGNAFYGWYTDPDYNCRWTGTVMPAADLTLYARIEPQIRIRYAVPTAAAGEADANLPGGWYLYGLLQGKTGDAFPMPDDPSPDGWSFMGWYLDPGFALRCSLTRIPEEDLIVYARMERLSIGGVYEAVDGGLKLTKYVLEEDESPMVNLPARISGVPVVAIGAGAFEESGAQNIVIPSTVTRIEPGALNCDTLAYISVSPANTVFAAEQGVLYSADKAELLCYPRRKAAADFTVPGSVEKIGGFAFAGNTLLNHVYYSGSSLTEIGESAFSGCSALRSAELPDSVTTLRMNAYNGCSAMETFSAYGLTTLETETGMDTLPFGTGMWVYGPVGEGVIRDYFTITDSSGRSTTLQYNQYQVNLFLNDSYGWETVFCEAGQPLRDFLADVELDDGTVVQEWHIDSADGVVWDLENDVMPAAEIWLYASFTRLFDVQYVDSPDYGYMLTAWNGSGSSAVIPESYSIDDGTYPVVAIGEGFFANSSPFTEITIPDCVTDIADGAFDGFSGTIVCDANSYAAEWADANDVEWMPILYRLTFDTRVGYLAPVEAGEATPVALPEPELPGHTFDGWYNDQDCYRPVELDENGLYIMPGSDTTLYASWIGDEEEIPFEWIASGEGVKITACFIEEDVITIPESIYGMPVVAIADGLFAGREIVQIDLGPVQTIGAGAFEGCESLRRVVMNGVETIRDDAFFGCTSLLAPELPETLTEIGDSAFGGCAAIGEITIPDSVIDLGADAFAGCTALKRIALGAGVKHVDTDVFGGCTALKQINVSAGNEQYSSADGVLFDKDGTTLILYPIARSETAYAVPEGVTGIGASAFAGAKALTGVSFPESLIEIGSRAFMSSGLTTVDLVHVQTVGESAFFGCAALESTDLGDSVVTVGNFAFAGCGSLTDVYIPATAQLDKNTYIFGSKTSLVITGTAGSSAHSYAAANGIAFVDPDRPGATALVLSETELTLTRGSVATLTASCEPASALCEIAWHTGNPAVALVDASGLVRAMGGGSTVITAVIDNGISAACTVIVKAPVEQIIPHTVAPMTVGTLTEVAVTFVPASPTDAEITWSSADESVATVTPDGVIEAIGLGSTTVTVSATNGVTAQIPVIVYTPAESMTIDEPDQPIYAVNGLNTIQLTASVLPEDATFTDCIWISADSGILSANTDGTVSGIMPGQTEITAISRDPASLSATLTVEVLEFDITEATVEIAEARMNADGSYTVDLTVTAGSETLVEGQDYSISWPEVTGAGNYALTLNGFRRLRGSLEVPFTLLPVIPEITMTDSRFSWAEDLVPVVDVEPYAEISLEYVLLGEDGSRTSVDSPEVNGLYEIIARTDDTETTGAAEARTTMWIQVDGGLVLYDSLTLTEGQSGRIPVAMESAFAPVQSGYCWSSDNHDVLTVNDDGTLTAVGSGSAVLTVTGADDERFTAACEITVTVLPALVLPAGLTAVEEEAFLGNDFARCVIVGEQVGSIGSRAFADCKDLVIVYMPDSVESIADDVFVGCVNVTFVCASENSAAAYAQKHSIPYVIE